MTPDIATRLTAALTREIRGRLDEAFRAAQAAEACTAAGIPDQAITLLLDVEQPIYEATILLNAASLIYRLKLE